MSALPFPKKQYSKAWIAKADEGGVGVAELGDQRLGLRLARGHKHLDRGRDCAEAEDHEDLRQILFVKYWKVLR